MKRSLDARKPACVNKDVVPETKSLAVVAAECKSKRIGSTPFNIMTRATGNELIPFIKGNIETGSKAGIYQVECVF